MKKREADFGLLFRHWIRANPRYSAAFELKQTTTNSFPFNEVKDHQIEWLQAANSDKGMLYKIPDDSRGIKPFDYVYLRKAGALIFIKYPGCFHGISVENFIYEKERSIRKSLTEARARDIAVVSVDL